MKRVHAEVMPGPTNEEKMQQAIDTLARLLAYPGIDIVLSKEILS